MIRIEIDIQQEGGQISITSRTGTHKEEEVTKGEKQVTKNIQEMIAVMLRELSLVIPGSKIATTKEDVETLRGLEGLDFKEDKL